MGGEINQEDVLDPNNLTPDQWIEIKSIAIQLYESGIHGKDHMKVSVHAFLTWLGLQDKSMIVDNEDNSCIH